MTDHLFSPLTLRGLTLRNRIGTSPMCQYSSTDGFATDWHLAHIGSFASGGAGLVMMEASGVTPEGRITPGCLGIWSDDHIPMLKRITAFAKSQGAAVGIQIAHAGRKASSALPWNGGKRLLNDDGGWDVVAPSAIPFDPSHPLPHALTVEEIEILKEKFVAAAKRAVIAGFDVIEIHAAHGYLLHSFLSPLSNKREDAYGIDRRKFLYDTAAAIRAAIPQHIVLAARLSCVDWEEGGITIEGSIETSKGLKARGVDFIDCSSGALTPVAKIPVAPGYQAPFAQRIRTGASIPTAAVGLITTPAQADKLVRGGASDLVFLAREMLRDPHFALRAAKELGMPVPAPLQYARAYG